MSGSNLLGAKVGLLDPYQVWAFMVDPFKNFLSIPLVIKGGLDSNTGGSFAHQLKNDAGIPLSWCE